ncbi:hypothetical protein A2U01_0102192, partial [Trifolium medium]|nr:hypothetical protein [Trifolium medium]
MLSSVIEILPEEIDASESLDAEASESYTPYATVEFSCSEALREAFPAVDASSLSSDSTITLLTADYD